MEHSNSIVWRIQCKLICFFIKRLQENNKGNKNFISNQFTNINKCINICKIILRTKDLCIYYEPIVIYWSQITGLCGNDGGSFKEPPFTQLSRQCCTVSSDGGLSIRSLLLRDTNFSRSAYNIIVLHIEAQSSLQIPNKASNMHIYIYASFIKSAMGL